MSEESKLPALFVGEVEKEITAHALARYQSARAVRIIGDRLVTTDKGKHGLEHTEALLIAQAAVANGLSPFQPQPELQYWIDIKEGKRQLTIMRARDGTIRLSEEAAERAGTYLEQDRWYLIDDEKEKIRLGFNADDLVIRCEVPDYRTTQEWYNRRQILKDEGLTSEDIDERVGKLPPVDIGYGRMTKKEMDYLDRTGASRTYPHINRTHKRAKVEALKKRWAARINVAQIASSAPKNLDAYIIEGEWREVDTSDAPLPKETIEAKGAKAKDTLYGDPAQPDRKSTDFWPKVVLKAIVEDGHAQDLDHAAGMLSYSAFDRTVAKTPALTYAKAYTAAKDDGATPKKAGEVGMAAYLEGLKKRRERNK